MHGSHVTSGLLRGKKGFSMPSATEYGWLHLGHLCLQCLFLYLPNGNHCQDYLLLSLSRRALRMSPLLGVQPGRTASWKRKSLPFISSWLRHFNAVLWDSWLCEGRVPSVEHPLCSSETVIGPHSGQRSDNFLHRHWQGHFIHSCVSCSVL